jgi:hypothetical protein
MVTVSCLEADLLGALRANRESETSVLHGQHRTLADGVRILEHWFRSAREFAQLGWVELPPRADAGDESYLLLRMCVMEGPAGGARRRRPGGCRSELMRTGQGGRGIHIGQPMEPVLQPTFGERARRDRAGRRGIGT